MKTLQILVSCVFLCATCHAVVFDWPTTPAWSGTGPTSGNTETVDYGYYANGSVSVSVFNSGEIWNAGFPIVQTGAARTTTGGTAAAVNGFLRFYGVAGMGHGEGRYTVAWKSLDMLEAWVERGEAPIDPVGANVLDLFGQSRPLCEYPAYPRYRGGNSRWATSFVCAAP